MVAAEGGELGTGRIWDRDAAAGYVFYVAFSHLVWSEASPHGQGWPMGLLQAAAISAVAFGILLVARRHPPTPG